VHTQSYGNEDLDLVVVSKVPTAAGIVLLALQDSQGRPLPPWQPGSHIDLVLGENLVRQYSLCGDPAKNQEYVVAVQREPHGRGGSIRVHDGIVVGARVRVRGPRNNFRLVDARSYLFIAGGIGITPLLPMIAAVVARGRSWNLAYGGRERGTMAFLNELTAHGRSVLIFPEDEVGRLDVPAILDGMPAPEETAVYCCGPEPLLNIVESECATRGLALHLERFAPKADVSPAQNQNQPFEVELARSGSVVPVGADETILSALKTAGVFVPTSCEEGVCGTCETAVIDGVPDHRDSLLDAEERAANDTLLICVSRSLTSRLVLDL